MSVLFRDPVWFPVVELLDEATINDLERETFRGFPNTTKRLFSMQEVEIISPEFIPYVGVRTLLVKAEAIGSERHGRRKIYVPMVLFTKVEYRPESDRETKTIRYKDEEYHFVPPGFRTNDVKVRCSCPDFTFRFSNENAKVKSLYGSPSRYKRKTDTRPPANPSGTPGICKHLGKLFLVLIDSDIVKR